MQFVFSGVRTKVSTNSPMRHHFRAKNSKHHCFATFFFNCIISNSVEDGRLLAARKRTYIATLAVQTAAYSLVSTTWFDYREENSQTGIVQVAAGLVY
jgi:hypothetical protein